MMQESGKPRPLATVCICVLLLLLSNQTALGATTAQLVPSLIPYSDGHGHWGYLDSDTLEVVIPPRFWSARPFKYGLGRITRPNPHSSRPWIRLHNWVRPNGELVFKHWFDGVYPKGADENEPMRGIITVTLPDGRSGVVSLPKGGWLVEPARNREVRFYARRRYVIDNHILVVGGQRHKVPDGVLIDFVNFKKGFIRITDGDHEKGVADLHGNVLLPPDYMTVEYFPEIDRAIISDFSNPIFKLAFSAAPPAAWPAMEWMLFTAVVDEDGNEIRSFDSDVYVGRLRGHIGYYMVKDDPAPRPKHYFSLITGEDLDASRVEAVAGLHIFQNNERAGLETVTGKVLIPAMYAELIRINSKLFIARKADTWDNGYGVINRHNEIVIPFQYDDLETAGHNRLRVGKNGLYGLIDWQGNIVIDLVYDRGLYFGPDGFAEVSRNGHSGVINTAGEVVVPTRYEGLIFNTRALGETRKIYFEVKKESLKGLYSATGELLVPPKYGSLSLDGIAHGWVEVEDPAREHSGLINLRADESVPVTYDNFVFHDHIIVANRYEAETGTYWYQPFTMAGEPITGMVYTEMEPEYDYFVARRNGHYGVLGSRGRERLSFVYYEITAVGPNLARARRMNGRWVYIGTHGRVYRPQPRH